MIVRLLVLLFALLLAACAHGPRNPLARWVPSKNYGPRVPVLIVIHHTEQGSVQESLDTLRGSNDGGPVSAHYLIGKDGTLYQLVSDRERAWHAGGGSWGTITDVNSASIGIELDNDGESPFPPEQIATLLRLLDDLCTRHRIPRTQVIGHADLAPSRKRDPNAFFPWHELAAAGFGAWPAPLLDEPPEGFDFWLAMRAFGYPLEDRAAALRAFRRRFRGLEWDDSPLSADDARVLYALTR